MRLNSNSDEENAPRGAESVGSSARQIPEIVFITVIITIWSGTALRTKCRDPYATCLLMLCVYKDNRNHSPTNFNAHIQCIQ